MSLVVSKNSDGYIHSFLFKIRLLLVSKATKLDRQEMNRGIFIMKLSQVCYEYPINLSNGNQQVLQGGFDFDT